MLAPIKCYGKEPTEAEKFRVWLALTRTDNKRQFINRGRSVVVKAFFDPTGVSYAFSLNDFASGRFKITRRKEAKSCDI